MDRVGAGTELRVEPSDSVIEMHESPAQACRQKPRSSIMVAAQLVGEGKADAVVSGLQIFPKDNPWNEDISDRPLHPDSEKIVAAIGRDSRFRWNRRPPSRKELSLTLF